MNVGVKRKIFLFGKISNNRLFLEISEFAATDYLPYHWQLFLPLIITTSAGIGGWFYVDYLSAARDLKNKQREIKVQYLIEAYRCMAMNIAGRNLINKPVGEETQEEINNRLKNIERSVTDIQLFGSNSQIEVLHKMCYDVVGKMKTPGTTYISVETKDLLSGLRNELRDYLGLERVKDSKQEIFYLRIPQ